MDNLLTIAAFAEQVGVTPQAIYKRLKTDLAPFLVEENGAKLLKTEALNLFKVTQLNKENQQLKELQARIEELERLNAELKADKLSLTEKLAANNEKLLDILEKQTQQQENYQVLVGMVQTSLTKLLPPVDNSPTELKEEETNFNKPSLFKRIFKRP